jgi:NAD(P)-dependent dehydrogenase (short-subunit alcohol dehydrogenase family)
MHARTALVTGANRGLGFATARRLASLGFRTIIGSRDAGRGELAAATLRTQGLNAIAVPIDVDSDTSVREAADVVAENWGTLDVLVNNAGILPEATATRAASPVDASLFRRTFETNVFGAVRTIQQFHPLLERAPHGHIVNVSSTMGSLADQTDPQSPYYGLALPAYQSSKAALNAITIVVAKLLAGSSVQITSVCPGWVQTDLGGPDNRAAAPLTADDAAQTVVDVVCAPAEWRSGQFVDASGPVRW